MFTTIASSLEIHVRDFVQLDSQQLVQFQFEFMFQFYICALGIACFAHAAILHHAHFEHRLMLIHLMFNCNHSQRMRNITLFLANGECQKTHKFNLGCSCQLLKCLHEHFMFLRSSVNCERLHQVTRLLWHYHRNTCLCSVQARMYRQAKLPKTFRPRTETTTKTANKCDVNWQ